jgi:hypothetical protein
MRRPRLLLALTLLALAVLPSAAHAAAGIGIADNKADMFGDPRFQALHLRYARLDLRWDVFTDAAATARLDTWMAGARATGARPLVTFDRSPRRPSSAGDARAAKVTRFIFQKLARISPRVQRVHLYHWDTGAGGGRTWDSAFVGPDGRVRPALKVLQGELARAAR